MFLVAIGFTEYLILRPAKCCGDHGTARLAENGKFVACDSFFKLAIFCVPIWLGKNKFN